MIMNLLFLSVAIFIVSQVMPAIHIKNFLTAIVVAVVYSIVSFFFGWLLVFLSFPFMILTFGLFKFVINAILLWMTDKLVDDFKIEDFPSTLIAAFFITIVDTVLKWIL